MNWKRVQTREGIYRRIDKSYRPIRTKSFCKGRYTIEGKKMLAEWLAKYDARVAWERVARVRESEQYGDWDYAADKAIRCWKAGRFKRCEASGIACRP